MLVRFSVKNFRSFKDETTLSMIASTRNDDNEYKELNTFDVDFNLLPKENTLIKTATIYGPNASGKSNVLKAIKYMRDAVVLSTAFDVIKHNEPFAFDKESTPTSFEIEFIKSNIFYNYSFSILNGVIVYEKLSKRIERLTTVFERNNNELKVSGVNAATQKFINVLPTILFLSQAKGFSLGSVSDDINNVLTWFSDLIIVFEEMPNLLTIYDNPRYVDEALEILKLADIGIEDFKVYKEKIEPTVSSKGREFNLSYPAQILQENETFNKIDIETKFNVYDKDGNVTDTKTIYLLKDIGFHSEGTKRLLMYLGWILKALDEGKVILIDELDSKLHFLIADYILKAFNSISKNINNAQLISTAHNLLLMDGDIRRDEILFTAKDYYGATILKALSDYKGVLKKSLFSKHYLLGFYTELPNMKGDL